MNLPDRHVAVPPYHVIKYGYVDINKVVMACRERMAVGDIDRAFQKLIQIAPAQPHPAPFGEWKDEVFEIKDGRHQFIASLMLGYEFLLVAWLEKV